MRRVSHSAAAALSIFAAPALAQTVDGVPIIVPSQSSIYNQNAVTLPTPPIANGQDVVRGVSGASCQSAIASAGPYLDLGVIGSQDVFNRDTAALYGRIVIPIGERPKRLDCTKLYELEITRLKVELDLLRLGAPLREASSTTSVSPAAATPTSVGEASDREAARPALADPIARSAIALPPRETSPPPPRIKPTAPPKTVSVFPASATVSACRCDGRRPLERGPI